MKSLAPRCIAAVFAICSGISAATANPDTQQGRSVAAANSTDRALLNDVPNTAVPEPGMLLMIGSGLVTFAILGQTLRRKRATRVESAATDRAESITALRTPSS